MSSLTAADLEACAQFARRWSRAGIATPLILPRSEFRARSTPFRSNTARSSARTRSSTATIRSPAMIAPDDLRRACETQAKSHLVHLREGYVESGGRPTAVAELVTTVGAGVRRAAAERCPPERRHTH